MSRLNFNLYLMKLAYVASFRGTCSKRQVGAVIADQENRIVAVNYNGTPSNQPHCIDSPCKALTQAAPQSHLSCRAIHAEANAIISAGLAASNGSMAITTTPCYECAKLIVNAGIRLLIVGELNRLYDDESVYSESPNTLLRNAGITVLLAPNHDQTYQD